jgi:hypothetical protein
MSQALQLSICAFAGCQDPRAALRLNLREFKKGLNVSAQTLTPTFFTPEEAR